MERRERDGIEKDNIKRRGKKLQLYHQKWIRITEKEDRKTY